MPSPSLRESPAWLLLSILAGVSCSAESSPDETASAGTAGVSAGGSGSGSGGEPSGQGGSAGDTAGTAGSAGATVTPPASVTVHLVPQEGVAGVQRVNFAVPLA